MRASLDPESLNPKPQTLNDPNSSRTLGLNALKALKALWAQDPRLQDDLNAPALNPKTA